MTTQYTAEEVAAHNSPDDLWTIIHGKVYDVTDFILEHPGGEDPLIDAAGIDSTEEFEDSNHSQSARKQMEDYLIGVLVEKKENTSVEEPTEATEATPEPKEPTTEPEEATEATEATAVAPEPTKEAAEPTKEVEEPTKEAEEPTKEAEEPTKEAEETTTKATKSINKKEEKKTTESPPLDLSNKDDTPAVDLGVSLPLVAVGVFALCSVGALYLWKTRHTD